MSKRLLIGTAFALIATAAIAQGLMPGSRPRTDWHPVPTLHYNYSTFTTPVHSLTSTVYHYNCTGGGGGGGTSTSSTGGNGANGAREVDYIL